MSNDNSVLTVYDIPQALPIKNPSRVFRRYGFRCNLSCWIFSAGHVPSDEIDRLRRDGATVHMVRFAAEDQSKILDLCRDELRKAARKMLEFIAEKSRPMKRILEEYSAEVLTEKSRQFLKGPYKKWRTLINKVRRELEAADQCAFAFEIGRDVADAFDAVRKVLCVELEAALLWKDRLKEPVFKSMELPMIEGPAEAFFNGVSLGITEASSISDDWPLCGNPLNGEVGTHSACAGYE